MTTAVLQHIPTRYLIPAMLTVVMLGLVVGCETTRLDPGPPASEGIRDAAADAKEASQTVSNTAQGLQRATDAIGTNVNLVERQAPSLKREVKNLRSVNMDLAGFSLDLTGAAGQLESMEATLGQSLIKAKSLEGETIALQAEIEELKDTQKSLLKRMLMYAILAGTVMIAAAGMMFAQGNMRAVGVGIGGIVMIITCLTLSFFMAQLAIVGAVGALVALGFIGFKVFEQMGDKKALDEIVRVAEEAKLHLSDTAREEVFGDLQGAGIAGDLQSAGTVKRVAAVRKKIGQEIRELTTEFIPAPTTGVEQ